MSDLRQLSLEASVRSGHGRGSHITTKNSSSFPADLQDEAKDDAKKEKDLNDFPDLTERSGRAVKVFSLVIFILVLCFTFCILYVFRLNETL